MKQRLSASVDAELVAVAQEAVAAGQVENVGAWVNEALRLKADHDRRLRAVDEFLAAYEAEHGKITDDEIRDAARSACGRAVVVRCKPKPRDQRARHGQTTARIHGGAMHGHWRLQEAKQRFSELIESVEADGPQFLTRHGEDVAVVVSIAEYRHLRNAGRDFKAFLQSPPDIDMEISRSVLPARRVEVGEGE